jgi:hypothetical protein
MKDYVLDFMEEEKKRKEKEATDEKHLDLGLSRREPMEHDCPKRGYDGR